jgi:hypothetical protein
VNEHHIIEGMFKAEKGFGCWWYVLKGNLIASVSLFERNVKVDQFLSEFGWRTMQFSSGQCSIVQTTFPETVFQNEESIPTSVWEPNGEGFGKLRIRLKILCVQNFRMRLRVMERVRVRRFHDQRLRNIWMKWFEDFDWMIDGDFWFKLFLRECHFWRLWMLLR